MHDSSASGLLPAHSDYFVDKLRALHEQIRDTLVCQLRQARPGELSRVASARGGDTIYGIDERGEEVLFSFCEEWGREMPFVLIAEGIPGTGERAFPESASVSDAKFRMIVDPIDGTRAIMYDKRSAWILSAVAPNHGRDTRLNHVEIAVQTEVPTTKQSLSDCFWAWTGGGAHGIRTDLSTRVETSLSPRPSRADTVEHGFAMISKFFPGGKAMTAGLEERLWETVLGTPADGNPLVFDDQYLSSGGQLYELWVGHDRFNADLRPLIHPLCSRPSATETARLCAHPYDLCTELIAREAGVVVTDDHGHLLSAPLDLEANIVWIGYANAAIQRQLEPTLLELVSELRETRKV